MYIEYNPPLILKKLFRNFIWNTSCNKMLLTFDDGPAIDSTETILHLLSRNKIKAAFFCQGNNISNNLSLTKEIISEGHLIGNHTYNHKRLWGMNREETVVEINSFNHLIKEKFNYEVKYFRPPYGRFNLSTQGILKELGLQCVMWSLLTPDYKNDFNLVKFAVKNYLKKNSIVVLHDSVKSKNIIKDSISLLVDEASKKEFSFGIPGECLK